VNGPEILHLLRHELQHTVRRCGKPSIPRPLDAWPVATLLQDAPEKPRRRIGCVANEDVGGPKCRVIAGVSFVHAMISPDLAIGNATCLG
jgi:hypothetical protein